MKRRYLTQAFTGEGARLYGGRWSSPGRAVVYTSESRALATLEILAGLQAPSVIPAYVLIGVAFPEGLVTRASEVEFSVEWRRSPPTFATQQIGDRWLDAGVSAVLQAPSAVVPGEYNYLLNPAHPGFAAINVGEPEELYLDPRLFSN